jgi:Flp pilus assembly protein TadD
VPRHEDAKVSFTSGPRRWRVGVPLALVSAAAFLPVVGNGFVSWDDGVNFLENVAYRGLGWENLRWAWTTFLLGVYQPVSWMLLEAEYVVWGMKPGGYHLTSVLLHAANSIILLVLTTVLLERIDHATGEPTRDRRTTTIAAAAAVALFAVHPLRVEVVAWASCQPYLACALFSMLSVLSYLRASDDRRPDRERSGWRWLSVAWFLFLAALLSKAVAVPIALVLVILDVYPLGRLGSGTWRRRWFGPAARGVWLEKLPFFALSFLFIAVAIVAKERSRALHTLAHSGFAARLAQACYGVCFYLVKTIAPFGLTGCYPLPRDLSFTDPVFVASVVTVLAVSVSAFLLRRRWPGLLAAWASYLVILAPSSGLIRMSRQIAADRYSYVASIGGVVALAYALDRICRRSGLRGPCLGVAAGLVVALSVLTWRQCLTWQSSLALWSHAHQHGGSDDPKVLSGLGVAFYEVGRDDEARATIAHALALEPAMVESQITLGLVLSRMGKTEEARQQFITALALDPGSAQAMTGLGIALGRLGRPNEAERYYREALRINPAQVAAHNNLGISLARRGRFREAAAEFSAALRINPDQPEAENNLGSALADQGKTAQAITHYAAALRLKPRYADAHAGMGSALARRGRPDEADACFAAALALEPDHPVARNGRALIGRMRKRPMPGR